MAGANVSAIFFGNTSPANLHIRNMQMDELEDGFRLPTESTGNDDSNRRISDLIEEIRADIDFELDDAVTDIVRDLPEEYFQRTKRADQVVHLKGLIASRICQLKSELFLPSHDGSSIAVLGRSNYRGQLANILSELPGKKTRLVGANIYTSKSHDFILDVFEFDQSDSAPSSSAFGADIVFKLGQLAGEPEPIVLDFLSRVRTTEFESPNVEKLAKFLTASQKLNESAGIAWTYESTSSDQSNIVVAVRATDERLAFQRVSETLARQSLDIEQAALIVLRHDKDAGEPETQRTEKTILMSFLLKSSHTASDAAFDATRLNQLSELLDG